MNLIIRIALIVLLIVALVTGYSLFSTSAKLRKMEKKYEKVLVEYTNLSQEFDIFVLEKEEELKVLVKSAEELQEKYQYNRGSLSKLKKENKKNKEKAEELGNVLDNIKSAKDANLKRILTNEELDLYYINLFNKLN